ncbi:hypothetical protein [Phnomibacter ginsenosidimutans]|uniref:Uncharacterized protein n=1 Tax=Phnomibacter ginsenosidimutans TaxID=2676868 RepID=A0A6I6GP80_9BACT|nr:hypothetical protein [Phnomibacter ginsenosidimutans]QGW28742.1 hypothetical protein GLV81_12100 [Phnomibacter ginsenosidimutans]
MHRILLYNWICAIGMLISFAMQGYGAVSISFSTLSIVVFAWAAVYLFQWMRQSTPHPAFAWLRAALWYGLLSTLGTAALSYMMASHQITQHGYLAAVYWYLHFQYNGWFFLGGMALFSWWLSDLPNTPPPSGYGKTIADLELPAGLRTKCVVDGFATARIPAGCAGRFGSGNWLDYAVDPPVQASVFPTVASPKIVEAFVLVSGICH